MEASDSLKLAIKRMIVEVLDLDDVQPEDIEDDGPLFIEGLGLDSIDALEIALAVEKRYGVKIRSEEVGQKILYSVNTLAEHIVQNTSAA